MGLSGETVIVRGWWANRGCVADGCACSSYPPARTGCGVGERETAPPALCLTSAPVI